MVMENHVWKEGGSEHTAKRRRRVSSGACEEYSRARGVLTLVEEGSSHLSSLSASIVVIAGCTNGCRGLGLIAKEIC